MAVSDNKNSLSSFCMAQHVTTFPGSLSALVVAASSRHCPDFLPASTQRTVRYPIWWSDRHPHRLSKSCPRAGNIMVKINKIAQSRCLSDCFDNLRRCPSLHPVVNKLPTSFVCTTNREGYALNNDRSSCKRQSNCACGDVSLNL